MVGPDRKPNNALSSLLIFAISPATAIFAILSKRKGLCQNPEAFSKDNATINNEEVVPKSHHSESDLLSSLS